jgi:hypothetical protein
LILNGYEDGIGIANALRSFAGDGHLHSRRGVMGDKGGKKDKEKSQKQKSEKQKDSVKNKQEKQPNKKV